MENNATMLFRTLMCISLRWILYIHLIRAIQQAEKSHCCCRIVSGLFHISTIHKKKHKYQTESNNSPYISRENPPHSRKTSIASIYRTKALQNRVNFQLENNSSSVAWKLRYIRESPAARRTIPRSIYIEWEREATECRKGRSGELQKKRG